MSTDTYRNEYYKDDLLSIRVDKEDEGEMLTPINSNMPLFMHEYIEHKGLISDFKQYIKTRQFIEYNKKEIIDGIWNMRRKSELKNLFELLKRSDPDTVDDLILAIHQRLDNK